MRIGVPKETALGERRVALVPEAVGRLTGIGLTVLVETGAGAGAWFDDSDYAEAGAAVERATPRPLDVPDHGQRAPAGVPEQPLR